MWKHIRLNYSCSTNDFSWPSARGAKFNLFWGEVMNGKKKVGRFPTHLLLEVTSKWCGVMTFGEPNQRHWVWLWQHVNVLKHESESKVLYDSPCLLLCYDNQVQSPQCSAVGGWEGQKKLQPCMVTALTGPSNNWISQLSCMMPTAHCQDNQSIMSFRQYLFIDLSIMISYAKTIENIYHTKIH